MIDDISETGEQKRLNKTLILLGIVFAVGSVATFVRAYLFTLAGERVVARLRKQLFVRIQAQEVGFFDGERTGELINRLASDTTVLQNAVTTNISMGLRWVAQVLVSVGMLFVVSWRLTAITLSVLPVILAGNGTHSCSVACAPCFA